MQFRKIARSLSQCKKVVVSSLARHGEQVPSRPFGLFFSFFLPQGSMQMQKTGRVAFEKKKEISFHITSHHSSKPPQEEGEERKDDPENAKMETGKTRGCGAYAARKASEI